MEYVISFNFEYVFVRPVMEADPPCMSHTVQLFVQAVLQRALQCAIQVSGIHTARKG